MKDPLDLTNLWLPPPLSLGKGLLVLVMGPSQFFVARVGSDRVSHLWFGFEFGKFPLKISNFSIFFLSGQKNIFGSGRKVPGSKAGQPLIYCESKVSSGRVGSGQGPSLIGSFVANNIMWEYLLTLFIAILKYFYSVFYQKNFFCVTSYFFIIKVKSSNSKQKCKERVLKAKQRITKS